MDPKSPEAQGSIHFPSRLSDRNPLPWRAGEVTLDGRAVQLTAREFALLAFFAQNRDRMLRRDVLLARVWGARYEGGARTVDIHVRRLRAKLGDALPLETLRGAGYILRTAR